MKILHFRPFDDSVKKDIQSIPLLCNREKFPYKNSTIQLLEFYTNSLNPSTLYYIKNNILFQEKLRTQLLELWYDTLKLWWILTFEWDDEKVYSIMPPVVEVSNRPYKIIPMSWEIEYKNDFSIKVPILLDGIHRALFAKSLWIPLQVLYIDNVDIECPPYAHPNKWDEIVACDETPNILHKKKHYISADPKSYYKDFSGLTYSHFRESK